MVDSGFITLPIIFGALCGAVAWGYFTWYFGLPSSSTHALIGGMIGVSLFANHGNLEILHWSGIGKVLLFMIISPVCGLLAGMTLMTILGWLVRPFAHFDSNRLLKRIQVGSAMFMSYSHGMNDAQNAMGIITIALLSAGVMTEFQVPLWVRIASAIAMGLGTSVGGWRIIKTMGQKISRLEPIDGCAAETSAGTVITISSLFGAPISTTHVISTAIVGAVGARGLRQVNWYVVRSIITAWLLTFPGAAVCGIICYLLTVLFL